MKISTKGIYSVNILTDIASSPDKMWTVGELSQRNHISVKYLERIISKLVKGHILKSYRGASGGYVLADKPSNISLKQILESTEGKMQTVSCVSGAMCDKMSVCKTAKVWLGLDRAMNEFLEKTTLEDIEKGVVGD